MRIPITQSREALRDLPSTDPVDLSSTVISPIDPFGIDDPCITSLAGHVTIADCDQVVCAQCGRIFWQ